MPSTGKTYTLKKQNRLRKPQEFQEIYANGNRLRGDHFSLIYAPNGKTQSRLGISVHGYKGAVKRNRTKRIIREFYRLNRSLIPPGTDIIVTVRRGFAIKTPAEFERAARPLLEKAAAPKSKNN